MRAIFAVFCFFIATFFAFPQQDKAAKDILDKSLTAFENAGGIKASFLFTLENTKNKTKEVTTGSISMKGAKFMIESSEYKIWFDGNNQWVYMDGNDEVNLTKPDADEMQMINPATILSIYKKGFNYQSSGEKKVDGQSVQEVVLIPQKKSDWKKIVIQIDKLTNLPVFIRLEYTNGMNNLIKIVKYQTKQQFADSLFSFDKKKYPNTEVIDLR